MKVERKGNSGAGYHFYYEYRLCPRRFYLRNILGFSPETVAIPLVYGSIIHRAFEEYYKHDREPDVLVKTFEEDMEDNASAFGDKFEYRLQAGRGTLVSWIRTYHEEDLKKFEILSAEETLEYMVGPPGEQLKFTVKLDRLVKERNSNNAFVVDTKTTGYSVEKAIESVKCRDQMTGYIMVAQEKYPDLRIDSAYIDVLFAKGRSMYARRSDPIRRSKGEITQFKLNLYGLISDITRQVKRLETLPEDLLFPRNGDVCTMYNHLCDYAPLCRLGGKNLQITPVGFLKEKNPLLEPCLTFGDKIDKIISSVEGVK